jgi:hypothetical protein
MLRFLADENFDGRITAGLLQRQPSLDLVRVQAPRFQAKKP